MNIALFGALGRVGKAFLNLAKSHNVWQIDKNFEQNSLKKVDVCVDFSLPSATKQVVDFCQEHRCPLVSGVTGRNAFEQNLINNLSQCLPVCVEENFSQGISLLKQLCALIAKQTNWQCQIVETHHVGKKDSPSGTAKALASCILQNKGSFDTICTHSLRLGSNFGRHQVIFATNGESITVTHQAENVEIFARGALQKALEIAKRN